MPVSLVIADDHPLMLKGLSDFLDSKGFNVIGRAEDGKSAYNLIVKLKPEIAILDIRMPYKTGLEIAEACKKNDLKTKIILITFDKDEDTYLQAKAFNVYGYILKEFAVEEIETCIAHVIKNESYFSEEIGSYLDESKTSSKHNILDPLTKAEITIVKLIADNKTSKEIAEELSISIKTVHKHRSNIVTKLKLEKKSSSLIVWATLNKEHF